jgi:hypothetical protein
MSRCLWQSYHSPTHLGRYHYEATQLGLFYDQLILVDWVNGEVLAVRPHSFLLLICNPKR